MKTRPFNYKHVPQSDSVVIVGGGPSTGVYAEEVKQYIKDNNSKVFSANYSYESLGIDPDYVFIGDAFKFVDVIGSIDSDVVIPAKLFSRMHRDKDMISEVGSSYKKISPSTVLSSAMEFCDSGHRLFVVGNAKYRSAYRVLKGSGYLSDSGNDKINLVAKIDKKGNFPYNYFGIAGLSALLTSLAIRPKKILVVGIDGVEEGVYQKEMFDGSLVLFDKTDTKRDKDVFFLSNIIMPTMKANGVQLETFSGVRMHGIDKRSFDVVGRSL